MNQLLQRSFFSHLLAPHDLAAPDHPCFYHSVPDPGKYLPFYCSYITPYSDYQSTQHTDLFFKMLERRGRTKRRTHIHANVFKISILAKPLLTFSANIKARYQWYQVREKQGCISIFLIYIKSILSNKL